MKCRVTQVEDINTMRVLSSVDFIRSIGAWHIRGYAESAASTVVLTRHYFYCVGTSKLKLFWVCEFHLPTSYPFQLSFSYLRSELRFHKQSIAYNENSITGLWHVACCCHIHLNIYLALDHGASNCNKELKQRRWELWQHFGPLLPRLKSCSRSVSAIGEFVLLHNNLSLCFRSSPPPASSFIYKLVSCNLLGAYLQFQAMTNGTFSSCWGVVVNLWINWPLQYVAKQF